MRCVTHHQVTAEGVERALEVIGKVLASPDEYGGSAAKGAIAARVRRELTFTADTGACRAEYVPLV